MMITSDLILLVQSRKAQVNNTPLNLEISLSDYEALSRDIENHPTETRKDGEELYILGLLVKSSVTLSPGLILTQYEYKDRSQSSKDV